MKTDLLTSIVLAIVGVIIAFVVCNLFTGEITPVEIETVEGVSIDLDAPDPEVFNYRALNPTVEVYVGDCVEYDSNGECILEQVNYRSSSSANGTNSNTPTDEDQENS